MAMKVIKKNFLNMILATDNEHGIGKDNDLAWFCSADLTLFKQKTLNTHIIMGHNTAKSLPKGKPLARRINVVLCSKVPENPVEGFYYFTTVQEVLDFVQGNDSWVIGGAEIYKLFAEHCDEIHETDIEGTHDCDIFFNPSDHVNRHAYRMEHPESFKGTIANSVTIWSNK
ncbi:dihydrofolate reductase [Colwellia phage 9A]|uniref:dihydrofolate reductase n=1 Tax=Colwellia phage 9A TaxID=765765 RepID=I3UMB2_9CAUD|nr:dihydrofolate reductase [Colwellia phage 9A]AFK66627.1 dihydrofolate reductase type I [Colwellia phage 9A]